jgi:hypothetical protein
VIVEPVTDRIFWMPELPEFIQHEIVLHDNDGVRVEEC